MKMSRDTYARLCAGIKRAGELSDLDEMIRAYEVRGLTPMRFRWDLLWHVQGLDGFDGLARSFYSDGLNDAHIDTALRRAVREMVGCDALPMNTEG